MMYSRYSWSMSVSEDSLRLLERIHEAVDLLRCVVDGERGARGAGHSETAHQRLRAVMARPDCDAAAVADLGEVVRVNAVEREAHKAAAVGRVRRPVDPQAGHAGEAFQGVCGQLALVRPD